MTAEAIDSVELQFISEGFPGHEALQFCRAQLLDVYKGHVVSDHGRRAGHDLVREAKSTQDVLRHFSAQPVVTIKTNPLRRLVPGPRSRLGNVMKEHRQQQRHRNISREQRKHEPGVYKNIPFRMVLRRLITSF